MGLDEPNGTTAAGFEPAAPTNNGWVAFQIAFYVLVIVLGVWGNGLIIRVYSIRTKSVKTTTAALVMALALSDLTVCLFRFRNLSILQAHLTGGPVPPAILYLEIPDKFAIGTTVTLTGLIAFDRYDCVCRPHNRLLGYRRALATAVGCFLFSVFANLPLVVKILNPFFQPLVVGLLTPVFQVLAFSVSFTMIVVCYCKVYRRILQHVKVGVGRAEVRPRVIVNGNTDTETPKIAPMLASTLTSTFPTGGTLQSVLSTSFPCASTSTFGADTEPLRPKGSTSLTVPGGGVAVDREPPTAQAVTLRPKPVTTAWVERPAAEVASQPHQASPHQPSTTRRGGQHRRISLQRKTTRMLFITSVVFILTWLPQGIYLGTQFAGGNGGESPVSSDAVFNLKPVLFLNNVVNPLIYGLANRRFRQDCIDVMKKLIICFR